VPFGEKLQKRDLKFEEKLEFLKRFCGSTSFARKTFGRQAFGRKIL
jgi:hypothetical protein